MREITVGKKEAGQRLDKFLGKYLHEAGKGFLYKMMRKKNIVLNGKRCEGKEMLAEGDRIKLFLSDETIEKFSAGKAAEAYLGKTETRPGKAETCPKKTKPCIGKPNIIYEDEDIILINKPVGMLSQKAKESDVSLVEYLLVYLLETGAVTQEDLRAFRPSVCNRLDRNTSGMVAAGKTLAGLQFLSGVFRDRSIHKYYQCIVCGQMTGAAVIDGWLYKDERKNQVTVLTEMEAKSHRENGECAEPEKLLRIRTEYEPLAIGRNCTLLRVTLHTGRSHQIRAHLASIGHPILGDSKYGGAVKAPAKDFPALCRKYRLRGQLLHSYRLEFPELTGKFSYLSGQAFEAPLPERFQRILAAEQMEPYRVEKKVNSSHNIIM